MGRSAWWRIAVRIIDDKSTKLCDRLHPLARCFPWSMHVEASGKGNGEVVLALFAAQAATGCTYHAD